VNVMENNDSKKMIFLKGMLMGGVELIPGVSAGTIALILGILPRLLEALKNFNLEAINSLRDKAYIKFWAHIDANFLLILLLGMLAGIALLINVVSFVLQYYPILVWSFFFGVILASALWLALRNINWKRIDVIVGFVLGVGLAYYMTIASPIYFDLTMQSAFFAGMFAICAMILPGLSGSFMLMLIGLYEPIVQALKNMEVSIVLAFAAGASIGVLGFSHALSYLFRRFPSQIYALLTGVMLGSLNKIWPWKEVMSYRVDSKGEQVPLLLKSISPDRFELLNTGESSYVMLAILFSVIGVATVVLMLSLEKVFNSGQKTLQSIATKSKLEQ